MLPRELFVSTIKTFFLFGNIMGETTSPVLPPLCHLLLFAVINPAADALLFCQLPVPAAHPAALTCSLPAAFWGFPLLCFYRILRMLSHLPLWLKAAASSLHPATFHAGVLSQPL